MHVARSVLMFPAMSRLLPVLVLVGCAPPVGLRPLTAQPGRAAEVGVGYGVVGPRPVGQDEWAGAAQGWATAFDMAAFDVSLMGAFDGEVATGGLGLRARLLDGGLGAVGVGIELGVGWAALEIPATLAVGRFAQVYVAPQFGTWGVDRTVRLPVGVDVPVGPVSVRGEAQLNYPDLDAYQRRLHLGLGVAYGFGDP